MVLISLIYNRTPDNQDFWIKFRYIFRLDQWKPRQRFGGSLSIFSEDVDVKWLVHHHGHGVDCIGWISLVHLTSKKSWAVSKIQGVDDPARTKTMRWDYSIFAKICKSVPLRSMKDLPKLKKSRLFEFAIFLGSTAICVILSKMFIEKIEIQCFFRIQVVKCGIGFCGLIFNSLSLIVFTKPSMKNSFNELLISLAVFDMIFLFSGILWMITS